MPNLKEEYHSLMPDGFRLGNCSRRYGTSVNPVGVWNNRTWGEVIIDKIYYENTHQKCPHAVLDWIHDLRVKFKEEYLGIRRNRMDGDCPRNYTRDQMLILFATGKVIYVDRKDAPELPELLELEKEGIIKSEFIEFDEQSSAIRFWMEKPDA